MAGTVSFLAVAEAFNIWQARRETDAEASAIAAEGNVLALRTMLAARLRRS